MLIWGTRVQEKVIGEGLFYCPQEGGDREYWLMLARNYFTFFFIPMIPLDVLGEYVQCKGCHSTYDPKVLEAPTSEQLAIDLSTAIRRIMVAILTSHGEPAAAQRAEAIDVVRRVGDREYGETALAADLRHLGGQVDAAEDAGTIAGILSPNGRESLLRECLLVVAAQDPPVPTSDVELLAEIGAALGMSSAHVRGVVSEVADRPPAIDN